MLPRSLSLLLAGAATGRPDDPSPHVMVDGRALPVIVRQSSRSLRMSLRVDAQQERVIVVRPACVRQQDAVAFAQERADWVAARLRSMPPRLTFAPNEDVPILGLPHRIEHCPEARRGVWAEGGCLYVSGQEEHVPRRVRDYLVKRAGEEIDHRARLLAQEVGRSIRRISIRDTRTRWGSCSSAGDLSFCWRLVMAPEEVLHYVVAHEVAHLQEMNHSHHFWAVVQKLVGDSRAARHWLKEHGNHLHRAGPLLRPVG